MRFGALASAALVSLLLTSAVFAAEAAAPENPPGSPSVPSAPEPLSTPTDIPARRITVSHFAGGSYNPIGLEYNTKIGYQARQGHSDNILFKDTYLFLGGNVRLNPCYAAVGPMVEWQPIAVFNLRIRADAFRFFGILGMLQSFRSPYDDYSDTLQAQRSAANDLYGTSGWHLGIEPTLQAQVGPIAIQNKLTAERWGIQMRGDDTVFYDAGPDTLIPANSWLLADEVNVVYLGGPLVLGASFRYLTPIYSGEEFRPGEDPKGVDNSNMRIGALAAYTFFDNGYTAFNKPTVFALVGVHLRNRYRTGADVSRVIPYVGVGVAFQQDFVL